MLLAGDAAGFADPFLGEDILYAVWSGRLAALAVSHALGRALPPARADDAALAAFSARPGEQPQTSYPRACRAAFGRELRHAYYLARFLQHAPRRLLAVMLTDPWALGRYVDILAGKNDYRGFNRAMLARLPRYLGRLLRGMFPGRREGKGKEGPGSAGFAGS